MPEAWLMLTVSEAQNLAEWWIVGEGRKEGGKEEGRERMEEEEEKEGPNWEWEIVLSVFKT